MTFNEFKSFVIKEAAALGLADYELYYTASESVNVGAFKHEIKSFESSNSGGVCFRCIVNGRMGYSSSEELSESAARSVVRRAADNASSLESDEVEFLGEGGKSYTEPEKKDHPLPSTEALIKAALDGQEALYAADPSVIDGCGSEAFIMKESIAIVNSKGLDLYYENKASGFVSDAVVSDGNEMSNSYEFKLGDYSKLDIDALAKKAVSDAISRLGASVPSTGVFPVVFSPRAMSSLLATYSSVFSAESARKGLSKFKDCEGTPVASEALTIVDDPFYKESPMPIGFDAEGTPTYKKNVIENGTLITLLYNLKNAAALGKVTTGNASKAGYDSAVGIRPFTMYIAPGECGEDELLKKAENGVYIDFLGGLHAGANVISGDFSLQSKGFLIENGVKTRPVGSFTVAGNFYDLLKQITAVGNEVEYRGFGMTSFASPSVLVEKLSIAGKNE